MRPSALVVLLGMTTALLPVPIAPAHAAPGGATAGGALAASTSATWAAGVEPPAQPPASELLLGLRRLRVVGSVLYVAAHPDDENTTLLAYLARGRMLRAGYLSITRGDGGQNLIGSEQGIELGIIRTQELLAARRLDGAEQLFTRARDFGYSKSPEETLAIWGQDAVQADVVRAIRRFQPDVVITRFSAQHSEGQHGHHTASAMLVAQAFAQAGRPEPAVATPGLAPFQPQRLLWNRSSWGMKPGEDMAAFQKLDIGVYLPSVGASVGEIAARSRSMHKSQGFGVAANRGPIVEYFKQLAGAPSADPLGGIDFTWRRFGAAGARVDEILAKAEKEFRVEAPEGVLPLLLQADEALGAVGNAHWRELKRRELREFIAACAGLYLEATAALPSATPGSEVKVSVLAINRSPAALSLAAVRLGGAATEPRKPLLRNEPAVLEQTLTLPRDARPSNPCWLEAPATPGLFGAADPALIGLPESPPALEAEFVVAQGERSITLLRPLAYKWVDPVAGERYRAFTVVPDVSVAPATPVLMFTDARTQPLEVVVKAGGGKTSGTLRLELPAGWTASPSVAPFELPARGEEKSLLFQVGPARGGKPTAGLARAVATTLAGPFGRALRPIEHTHIPPQAYLADATVRLQPVELKKKGNRIGYVPGAGDEVAESLRRVGYEVTVLGDDALGTRRLEDFDAIVIGVRAFNTNERMRFHRERLFSYVAAGGTLVVQYNTQSRIARLVADIGPAPFEISRDRVTDEKAAVTFVDPRHPTLTTPNVIGPADFEGWVQERGLYFATQVDARYETPLEMADPGEKPSRGSLLVLKHGKGRFVYTGLAFFRQLPAGVPGAYRLFANLLAHGR